MTDEIDVEEYRWIQADEMMEIGRDGLQERVRQRAIAYGWKFFHTWNSQKSAAGFPDCEMVRPPYMIKVELKRQHEEPTPDQQGWLDAYAEIERAIKAAGYRGAWPYLRVRVWRPMDLLDGTIDKELE